MAPVRKVMRRCDDSVRLSQKPRKPDLALQYSCRNTTTRPCAAGNKGFAALQFVLALGAVLAFLWNADAMTVGDAPIWCTSHDFPANLRRMASWLWERSCVASSGADRLTRCSRLPSPPA